MCLCLTGLEIIEESSFIDIKYVLQLVSVDYFEQSITVLGFTMTLSPNIVLYIRLCRSPTTVDT